MRHKKGESCQMAFESYPSKVMHTCQGKPAMPLSYGYTYPQVVDMVGFHCLQVRGVSPAAEAPRKGYNDHRADPILQTSSLGPHSLQMKCLSHFLEKR